MPTKTKSKNSRAGKKKKDDPSATKPASTSGKGSGLPKLTEEMRAYFQSIAKLGGSLGGKARAARLTAEERSAIASKAAQARIAKYGQTPGGKAKKKEKPKTTTKKQKLKRAA